ncbi:chaperonin cofactor prefoldin [Bradyrhizobium huanghuaihaiense]|jgi:chaperonin cofactor prefoldin|uniref:Nodulation protein NopA n=11 Tax=Bradyrhizobium TaxID=374 RepID=A0A939LGY5_9BRAD|nr:MULTISPECIES: hypothetical protein [Bradyrhizobium]AJA65710.1 hypothetical protein RN69_39715 [Bradyrhizobium japonicum]AND87272.1 hypothetical protein AAV28_05135 [Bradyrhizobium diazoefficiens USDA 110]APG15352.1 hypothetical protein BKD09_44385 [Bradyrhizobium japonicum]APO50257.1 hypothetical protein BD122_08450 [Bradyrhizobium diazoefficiens]AWL91712.1 hypothetical protein CIT37_05360 [Bradyrhizobium ottawaense]
MAVNSVGGNGAAPATQQTQDAGFQNQMAEFERVSQKVQAQAVAMRRITTELSSEKKVADERVQ